MEQHEGETSRRIFCEQLMCRLASRPLRMKVWKTAEAITSTTVARSAGCALGWAPSRARGTELGPRHDQVCECEGSFRRGRPAPRVCARSESAP